MIQFPDRMLWAKCNVAVVLNQTDLTPLKEESSKREIKRCSTILKTVAFTKRVFIFSLGVEFPKRNLCVKVDPVCSFINC